MFLYWIGWPHVRNVFTCVGTETLLLNFLGKEMKHLISVVWWQYTVSLRMCLCWKRTSNSATGGNIWFLLGVCVCVCEELIPKSIIELFFRLQQPMFKRWFLQMTFDRNLMTVRSRLTKLILCKWGTNTIQRTICLTSHYYKSFFNPLKTKINSNE